MNLLTPSMIHNDLAMIPIWHSQIGGRIHPNIGTFKLTQLHEGSTQREEKLTIIEWFFS